jgi:RNA polymerase sigma factor (sigma-70 family)
MFINCGMQNNSDTYKYNDDQKIWLSFQEGNEQAYAEIYTAYFNHLFRYGKKFTTDTELIEDCIQDLFVSLWKSRETLSLPESVKNYLFKALRFSIFKKLKITPDYSLDDFVVNEYTHEIISPQESILISEDEKIEAKLKIEKALKTLPKRQKEAIFLKFYSELSYPEIAEIMQISAQAVYNLISKSIIQLQNEMALLMVGLYLLPQ